MSAFAPKTVGDIVTGGTFHTEYAWKAYRDRYRQPITIECVAEGFSYPWLKLLPDLKERFKAFPIARLMIMTHSDERINDMIDEEIFSRLKTAFMDRHDITEAEFETNHYQTLFRIEHPEARL